ncbi:MAG: nuclear transport factor 2 family protein, partial [Gammaproteobacteria bacterium]|nr:nuclear transport factor 2 family protein [Gammaproteobacteria bacterium]
DHDVWSVISQTVEQGDINGMAAVYHEDAVLVGSSGTVLIAEQLVKWGEDMEVQKQLGTKARVAFRFSSHLDDKATAFETGIFQYIVTAQTGEEESVYVGFESLMVKKRGTWLILMERQLGPVDPAVWAALGDSVRP